MNPKPSRSPTEELFEALRPVTLKTLRAILLEHYSPELSDRIVQAVNAHEELLDTLKGITKAFKKLSEKYEPDNTDSEWLAHATEAIANAEGK